MVDGYLPYPHRFGVCTPARPWQWRSFQLVLNLHTGQLWRMPLVRWGHQSWCGCWCWCCKLVLVLVLMLLLRLVLSAFQLHTPNDCARGPL